MMIRPVRVFRDKFRRKDVPVVDGVVVPWWVNVLTDWGRPVVATVVLTMCAPGEHYLAHYAGWSSRLAWGMPFVLTAYAGISAVVATKRPKGSPGKRTAVLGAILSILLAMAAQPIAHLYQLQLISGHRFALVIVTSCIPALVLGHLLHLAVSHVLRRRDVPAVPEDRDTGPEDTGTRWLFEDKTYRAGVPVPAGDKDRAVSLIAKAFDVPEDILKPYPRTTSDGDTRTGQTAPAVPVSSEDRDTADVPGDTPPVRPSWLYDEDGVVPGHREDTGDAMSWSPPPGLPVTEFQGTTKDDLSSRRKLTDVIKDIRRSVGDDPDAIKDAVLTTPGFEDMRSTPQKRNTLNTAVRRALAKTA